MKIIRDGKEIELTDHELWLAHEEKQRQYDRQYIEDAIKSYCADDESLDIEAILENEDMIDAVASKYRDYFESYIDECCGDMRYECLIDSLNYVL